MAVKEVPTTDIHVLKIAISIFKAVSEKSTVENLKSIINTYTHLTLLWI